MKKGKLNKSRISIGSIGLTCIACVGFTSTLTSCGISEEQIKTMVLPTVKTFTDYQYSSYQINDNTTIAVNLSAIPDDPVLYPNNSRKQMVREIFQNIVGEYYAKLQTTKHPLASHPQFKTSITNTNHEITFSLLEKNHLDNLPEVTADRYPEAYQINVSKDTISVQAFNENGWIAAAKTLLQLQISNNDSIPCGKIADWPKINQRGIEFDFSGRGYNLDFVADLIKTMSWNKLNTLALRFASGGMRLDCKKIDEAPADEKSGTWFKINYHDYNTDLPNEDVHFNLNTNYRDNSPVWEWNEGETNPTAGFSDFGNILNLAYKEGVNIIPEINIFTHAWFLTDLTRPIDKNSNYSDDGKDVTDSQMKEKDFAIWDDYPTTDYPLGKRIPDSLDLRGVKAGSKAVIDICKKFLTYLTQRFTSVGNYNKHALLSFGIGGDEYIETLDNRWNNDPNTWITASKQAIVDSIYTFSETIYNTLKTNKITNIVQWSDSLLKNYGYDWPTATTSEWDKIYGSANALTIKHWWSKYGNANIEEFVKPYQTGIVGGGINKIVNYNSDLLYFSDDESNTSTAPTAKSLFNQFHPGIFAGDAGVCLDNNGVNHDEYPSWLQGSMLSVWWDWSPHVATMIDGALKAFAQKTWNGTDNLLNFDEFSKLASKLGRAPLIGWE